MKHLPVELQRNKCLNLKLAATPRKLKRYRQPQWSSRLTSSAGSAPNVSAFERHDCKKNLKLSFGAQEIKSIILLLDQRNLGKYFLTRFDRFSPDFL